MTTPEHVRRIVKQLFDEGVTPGQIRDVIYDECPEGDRATEEDIERARAEYARANRIDIDSNAHVSQADDGVWVQAWVWLQDAGE